MYCKNCGATLLDGAEFCTDCGVLVGNGDCFCAECGAETNNGKRFCAKCGADLFGDVVLIKSDKPIAKTNLIKNQNNHNTSIYLNNAEDGEEVEKIVIPDDAKEMLALAYEWLEEYFSSKNDVVEITPRQEKVCAKINALYIKAALQISETDEFNKIKAIYKKINKNKIQKILKTIFTIAFPLLFLIIAWAVVIYLDL